MFERIAPGHYEAELDDTVQSPILFQPTMPFRLTDVKVSDGWQIGYVMVGNTVCAAFAKPQSSYPPERIQVFVGRDPAFLNTKVLKITIKGDELFR